MAKKRRSTSKKPTRKGVYCEKVGKTYRRVEKSASGKWKFLKGKCSVRGKITKKVSRTRRRRR